jgi:hypothetical protein
MVRHGGRSGRRWLGLASGIASLLTGALVVLVLGEGLEAAQPETRWGGSSHPGPAPRHATGDDGPRFVAARPAARVQAVPPEHPRSVRLPSGRVVPVAAVSTTGDGRLEVPDDVESAGWWQGGARVGDPFGSSLVAAHVDSLTQGLGPFAELLAVEPGARIELTTHRLRQVFRVRALQVVPRASVRDIAQWSSPRGPRRLSLVTCAGPYVAADGGYQNLVVVTARPTGPPVQRRGSR